MNGVMRHRNPISNISHVSAALLTAVGMTALLLVSLIPTSGTAAHAQDVSKSSHLSVLNYVTGWEHDANGYHPAVFMWLENVSSQDLSGRLVRFQARFTDLQTAEVTIGRKDVRRDCKPHQQFAVAVVGAQGYELPFETHLWPSIEAKVMCRIGNVGDEGTETLTIVKVEPTTHTEEEAFETLNQATSYAPRARTAAEPAEHAHPARNAHRHEAAAPPEKPLVARAERLTDQPQSPSSTRVQPTEPKSKAAAASDGPGAAALFNSRSLPGLGDDFYAFEQRFGLPREYDAKHSDWTWARYWHKSSGTELIAGSHDRKGTVDLIVLTVPRSGTADAVALVNSARNFAGKHKAEALSSPARSVRYLPSGRVELVTRNAAGYRVIGMTPSGDSDNGLIVVLSRAHQDAEQLLASQAQKCSLLKCLRFLESPKDSEHD
jgi:hypothetical protein